jgi:hypothetical protein
VTSTSTGESNQPEPTRFAIPEEVESLFSKIETVPAEQYSTKKHNLYLPSVQVEGMDGYWYHM